MPDDPNTGGTVGGNAVHTEESSPDLVGEELGDGARIWRVYEQVAREEDRERTANWYRGLDNLALFAGIFSAVTTAFIIQLQQNTQPDYARLTFLVLNASSAGVPFADEPFAIDRSVRTTNCLWIASLILSLTAALIAIMGKDWIGTYSSRPVCNPRQWAEIRTYRLACVERWYMSGVIAFAPVLLHVSLALFAAGLVIFVAPDPLSQCVAFGLTVAAGGSYLAIVLSAIVISTSPFKSPATQAVRGTIISTWSALYGRLAYRPKEHTVARLLQNIHSGVLPAQPMPLRIPESARSQRGNVVTRLLQNIQTLLLRRRLQRGDTVAQLVQGLHQMPLGLPVPDVGRSRRGRWDFLAWRRNMTEPPFRSWARSGRVFAGTVLERFARFFRSRPAGFYPANRRYRDRRPRTWSWKTSIHSYLGRIDHPDRWAEVRVHPTPRVLAQSLSHLNTMTQDPDVFRSILVALGDIAIGCEVAPLVSFDLKSRLRAEFRYNWQKVDLVTLSRYILTDQHLSGAPVIPDRVTDRFATSRGAIKHESIVFALAERQRNTSHFDDTIIHFTDLLIQPRALQHLLPRVNHAELAILLVQLCGGSLDTDHPTKLHSELRNITDFWLWIKNAAEPKVRHSRGRESLVDGLVNVLGYLRTTFITKACALILQVVEGGPRETEYPCLVYAFGNISPKIANAAWQTLPPYDPSPSRATYVRLERALPLNQYLSEERQIHTNWIDWDSGDFFQMCLARAVVRLLLPSRAFYNTTRSARSTSASSRISTLELCLRCLHSQLCFPSGVLQEQQKLGVVSLMLDEPVLARFCDPLAPKRKSINILTAIARLLCSALASQGTYDIGARLFCLYSFSEGTDWERRPVTWDLGSYLRGASALLPLEPDIAASLRRLASALHALRPLCEQSYDLCAAWERIGLDPGGQYQRSFWDADDFMLGPLLEPDAPQSPEEAASQYIIPIVTNEEFTALHWLEAAMYY